MWDFSISKTLSILLKTYPYILLRIVIFFSITLAYIIATGTGAGIGYGVGNISSDIETQSMLAFWGAVFGFGAVSMIVYWIREYLLYVVKAGHIAVMVRLLDGVSIPGGQNQLTYGKDIVAQRFTEANVLFALDQVIKGVISIIAGFARSVGNFLPIPGLDGLISFFNTVMRMSLTYVDEVILGYNMRINSTNPYESAQDGLVLYAQNSKYMIKNAMWLSIMLWLLTFVVFIIMLAPAAAILYYFPGSLGGWSFVLAIVFAWALKAAILEPFAIAALMSVYFAKIEGQVPDPAWRAKLSGVSNRFSELKDKAMSYVSGDNMPPQKT